MTKILLENSKFQLDQNIGFNHDVKKIDYIEISPNVASSSMINSSGDVVFSLQQSSNPIDICNSFIYFKIKISDLDKTKVDLTLENDFFPRMFERMQLTIGNTIVENFNHVGEMSSILNFVMNDYSFKQNDGELSGWIPDDQKGDTEDKGFKKRQEFYSSGADAANAASPTFEGIFPLKLLFGFLQDYNRILYLIKIELIMNRKIDNKEIFFGKAKASVGANAGGADADLKAKCEFTELKWFIPEITLNPILQTRLLDRLRSTKPILVNYLKRITSKISVQPGTIYTFSPGMVNSRPKYIFVGFKKKDKSYKTNNSLFIQKDGNEKLVSLIVELNSTNYPRNPIQFDYDKNFEMRPYLQYKLMCLNYGNEPQLSYQDFKNLYSIFCFDVSDQDVNDVVNGMKVNIIMEKTDGFQPDMIVLILLESLLEIELSGGEFSAIKRL